MKNKKDYLDGDHSFKNWFKIMWENKFIQLFSIFSIMLIMELFNLEFAVESISNAYNDYVFAGILVGFGFAIPPLGIIIIGYKGFYQFWNDLKNGISR